MNDANRNRFARAGSGVLWCLLILSLAVSLCAREKPSLVSVSTDEMLSQLRASTEPAGFWAVLGCGDGQLTARLAAGKDVAVHALEADQEKLRHSRTRLQERSLYGRVAVEFWNDTFLPYADNLLNALVAEDPGAIELAEMLRVLAPHGVLWLKEGGRWRAVEKPWPQAFDEWTHWRHGADGNMVSRDRAVEPPTGLRWIAGPPQDDHGRQWYYDHVLLSANGRNFYVYEDEIVARDSFNGRLLWRRPVQASVFKEKGVSAGGMNGGVRTSKVRPVAQGRLLYVVVDGKLIALNAVTGDTVQTYGDVHSPREILLSQDRLVVSDQEAIQAFNLDGARLWQWAEPARRMVVSQEHLFFLNGNQVVCLRLADGKQQWRTAHAKAAEAATCACYEKVLVLERSSWNNDAPGNGLVVFDTASGSLLWTKDYAPGMSHYRESRTCFADGLVWVELKPEGKGAGVKWSGLDPLTGEERKRWGTRGLHCSAPLATERFFIAAELEFTDLKTGEQSRARMVKSGCRLPFIPANGLLYTFPVQCECWPMLRGYMGLAQTAVPHPANRPRLQTGPAWGSVGNGPAASVGEGDWPVYRHDNYRSGSTPCAIPAADLKLAWQKQVAQPGHGFCAADWNDDPFVRGLVSAPVCAGNRLLLAIPNQHRVVALAPETGRQEWSYVAGGRVDTPPTIADNACLFGAHDGYVYCLSLADGRLAWRFRAAPQEARIAVYGQMESPWPVAGSVLVERGVAIFAAGRHPASDGGVRVCAVQVRNGELLWEKTVTDIGVTNFYAAKLPGASHKVGVDYEPVDLLVRDGDKVAMSRWQFQPETGEMNLAFAQTQYTAWDGLKVPRGLWGYGIRQTKQVRDKPPAAFNQMKVFQGADHDAAILLAAGSQVTGTAKGELKLGSTMLVKLEHPLLHDGLIVAGGRLYAATRDGWLYCFAGN